MKHIFIINPVSGHGRSSKLVPWIHAYFANRENEYQIFITTGNGHAIELAAQYSVQDDVTVYACGGDGTAYEVLNGLQEGVPMAVIPSGTGNDFTRSFQYPKTLKSLKDILIQTIEGRNVQIDIGEANGLRFHNCTTMGLDAKVTIKAQTVGKKLPLPSKLVYIVSLFMTLKERAPVELQLTLDGKTTVHEMILCAVMNGKFYGGGFKPTPDASVQDGLFDVCLVDYCDLWTILRLLPKYMFGTHIHEKQAHFYKADKLEIRTLEPIASQIDGEVYHLQEYKFIMRPKWLTTRVPQDCEIH
jgi:diacylglycerol kinase (ATP)